ncbi:hypothetical protein [Clostridium butyricum]|uniref:hypothetical protein n=1 Tax=Clostridium butyricum TaxID=1492 RepID=UPI002ABE13B6|nr:hypothetical protein [Clostridium butyricum]
MSYIRSQIQESILKPIKLIQENTLSDNNLTDMMNCLNSLIKISEYITQKDEEIGVIWNEIINDIISVIHSAISGFYHSGSICLRSILELASGSFYYYDHKIEYNLLKDYNYPADKYVSTLVNDYSFYKTAYIESFYKDIRKLEKSENDISQKLKKIYSDLCDIVHGRYKTLTKTKGLEIKYSKSDYKLFENYFYNVMSIISVMFILRFNYYEDEDIIKLANKIKVGEFKK